MIQIVAKFAKTNGVSTQFHVLLYSEYVFVYIMSFCVLVTFDRAAQHVLRLWIWVSKEGRNCHVANDHFVDFGKEKAHCSHYKRYNLSSLHNTQLSIQQWKVVVSFILFLSHVCACFISSWTYSRPWYAWNSYHRTLWMNQYYGVSIPQSCRFFYNYVSDIWSYRFYLHKLYKISYMNIKWSH